MSSIANAEPNGQPYQRAWATVAPYVAPPLAAGAAIVPVYYGFIAKSAQQMGRALPWIPMTELLIKGCKAAPTVGMIVGTQMVMQNVVEDGLKKYSSDPNATMFASALIVGALSAPLLAIFNGQTMGQTPKQSLKALCKWQTGAIVSRETSFLFSLRVSEPIAKEMERLYGKNRVVECACAFVTGAVGSLIGHPADTALTLWQKGMKVENLRQLMRGGPMKALTLGGFTILYGQGKKMLNP